jgi:Ribosomal protein S30
MQTEVNFETHKHNLLFSGKVHGSLARAGKVKGQTPRVSYINHKILMPTHYIGNLKSMTTLHNILCNQLFSYFHYGIIQVILLFYQRLH